MYDVSPQHDRARGRPAAMTDIFVSYRRDDSGERAERLIAALTQTFGLAHVVHDIDVCMPLEDAAETIDNHLHSVDIVMVLIGPDWLVANGSGQRRLEVPGDLVDAEIRGALAAGKPVWPVLVGGAAMPAADDLPATISGLARRPPVVLGDSSWTDDVARLVEALRPRQAPPVATRTGLWELTGTVGVLVATLLIGDSWIERELAQRSVPEPAAAVADGAHHGSRSTAEVAYFQGARHDELFALRQPGAIVGSAGYLGQPLIAEDRGLAVDRPLPFPTRSEALAGDGHKTQASRHRGHLNQEGTYFVLDKTDGEAASPPLSFVGWKDKP